MDHIGLVGVDLYVRELFGLGCIGVVADKRDRHFSGGLYALSALDIADHKVADEHAVSPTHKADDFRLRHLHSQRTGQVLAFALHVVDAEAVRELVVVVGIDIIGNKAFGGVLLGVFFKDLQHLAL